MNKRNSTPGIVIAGTSSGSGKTTITSAIIALLNDKLQVQSFKTGPDYIDPQFHTAITHRYSRNLDSWMLDERTIRHLYRKASDDTDISIIEGVMGLFDGFGLSPDKGSTAHVAKTLGLPVVITVDGRGVSSSIAATIKGFAEFDPTLNVAGVIFNKLHGDRHYQLLKGAVEKYTNIPVLGYLNYSEEIELSERHLGLVPQGEVENFNIRLEKLKHLASRTLDITKLIRVAKKESVNIPPQEPPFSLNQITDKIKIAIAYDKAFNFYYRDNLELLETLGAELVNFSPLEDSELPENISGIILGGGFPEVFASELSSNHSIRESIKKALSEGIPCYAECGGFMYLCNSIKDFDGNNHEMTGWFNMESEMTSRLQRFGYIELSLDRDCIIGKKGASFRAHEFHRSIVHNGETLPVYNIRKEYFDGSEKNWNCGFIKENTLGGYPHIHFYASPETAFSFIRNCEGYLKNKK